VSPTGGTRVRLQTATLVGVKVIGAVLAVLAATESITRAAADGASAPLGLVLCLLALSTTVPLIFLRPTGALLAISVASVLSVVPFHSLTVAGACAQLLAAYRFGRGDVRLLAGLVFVPFVVLGFADPGHGEGRFLTLLLASLIPAAAWAAAATQSRRAARAHSAAQEAIAGTSFEHAARGERARIARELHDVVAHHISIVAVQAETARLTTPGMPAAGAQRLSDIGDTARAALTEMRRLMGVLREDVESDTVATRRPQPGLAQLNELLDVARDASGSGTRLIVHGSPVRLDPGVELAAYRIAQEALTNARRHAPGAAVDIELLYTDEVLWLRIRDNGPGLPVATPVGAHGLLGMGERAAAVGGRLRLRAAAGGGTLVEATLPTRSEVIG
jgi:signal transduction histidine kinase